MFIGLGVSDEATRGVITAALDSCLLTDEEMRMYEDAREVRYHANKILQINVFPISVLFWDAGTGI